MLRKFRDLSLVFKISFSILLVEAFVLSILGIYYVQRFRAEVDQRVRSQIKIPSTLMAQGALNYSTVQKKRLLSRLVGQDVQDAMLIRKDGKVFYASRSQVEGKPAESVLGKEWDKTIKKHSEKAQIKQSDSPHPQISILSALRVNNRFVGYLYLKVDNQQAVKEKSGIAWVFIMSSLLCILITSLTEVLLVHNQVIPRVRDTVDCLKQVEGGNLAARVSISPSQDELGQLQGSVNAMIEEIEVRTSEREQALRESEKARAELAALNKELKEARDSALEASQSKSAFLANMSHELRTPLNAIIGYSELIQEEAEDLEDFEFEDDLDKISTSAKNLLDLIDNILDLSKIEAGHFSLYPELLSLTELISEIEPVIRLLAKRNNNELNISISEHATSMRTDANKLRRLLLNLLGNAAKFTKNGTISLRVRKQAEETDSFEFEILDTGIGIKEETLETIFQPFQQADNSATRIYGGAGLGLSIVRHFCDLMGGNIEVQSELGTGSQFTILLPELEGA